MIGGNGNQPRDIRGIIRLVVTTVAVTVFVGGFLEGLIQSNVQKWAEANGYDQLLVHYAGPVMDKISEITQSSWFFGATWFFIGGALLLWIDYALRRRTKKMAVALLILAIAIAGIAIWIFVHPDSEAASAEQPPKISEAERAAIIAPFQTKIASLERQLAARPDRIPNIPQTNSNANLLSSITPPLPSTTLQRGFTTRTVRELRAFYEGGRTRLQADAFIADEKGKLIETEGNNVPAPLNHAEHNRLVVRLIRRINATDECFVGLHRLAGTAKREVAIDIAHVQPDQVTHAPRRLVRHAKLPLNLFRRHAISRLAEQKHDVEPVTQAGACLFEGCPGGRVNLIAAMLAGKAAALLDPVISRLFLAFEASEALAETVAHQMRQAGIFVGETFLELAYF
jgi:hypothetical protein